VLIREKLGKRPFESNETNIDDIITENLALRKVLSHSNTKEKSLNMLIKSSRKCHDKKGIDCEQNNASTSTSSSHSRLSTNIPVGTFKNKPLRKTNRKGPKAIWVPKNKIIPLADMLNSSKKTPIMVPGQWMLTTHDGRKVYIPRPPNEERREGNFWRKSTRQGDWWWNGKSETYYVY